MTSMRSAGVLGLLALTSALCGSAAQAQGNGATNNNGVSGGHVGSSAAVKKVFVIAMENHNWTQPANQFTGGIQQIYGNPAAPFINSLVNGTAYVVIGNKTVNISEQVAYATAYHNVLATQGGNNPHIHPSEPNYLWAEAGTNYGIANDNDPYPSNVHNTTQHLSGLLDQYGHTWKSYQEDIDLQRNAANQVINLVLPEDQWTVPLTSLNGVFGNGTTNGFNLSSQYNYAAKHNPMVFFSDTNGNGDATPANTMASHYAPLQQLFADLANGTVADYNWITPDQYNDQHTALTGGYQGLTGDPANLKQGDDFLRQVVPAIMASKAYQDNGVIILWWDEAEGDGVSGDNADDFTHTIPEIIISSRAHKNVDGLPYASTVNLTHSSDLRTMEEIFRVGPLLGDAVNVPDLSDLFDPGSIPQN